MRGPAEASFQALWHPDRNPYRVLAQLELDFNSVERIAEYLEVPQEAPAIVADHRPPAYWPSSDGELRVEALEVKYAPDLPSVLHGISFTVHPAEKIGVVGRTGSGEYFRGAPNISRPTDHYLIGKSTLALSLLRIVEPSGGAIM